MKPCFLLLLVFLCFGCSEPTTSSLQTAEVHPPKAGSWFRFTGTQIDTNGTVESHTWSELDSVVESGLSIYGRDNVCHFRITHNDDPYVSEIYVNYKSNGDIELYTQQSLVEPWILLPFGSHLMYNYSTLTDKDTMAYVGEATINIDGVPYNTSKVQQSSLLLENPSEPEHFSAVFSYSPTLGYWVEVTESDPVKWTTKQEGKNYLLTSYALK